MYPEQILLGLACVVLPIMMILAVAISIRNWWKRKTWYPQQVSEVKLKMSEVRDMDLELGNLRLMKKFFGCMTVITLVAVLVALISLLARF